MINASFSFIPSTWLCWFRIGCTTIVLTIDFSLGYRSYCNFQLRADESNIANLNAKVLVYREKVGSLPDLNLVDLYRQGLTKERIHRTPFGGYYRLSPDRPVVYNPNLASR